MPGYSYSTADTGHHNCRDYHLPIPTSSTSTTPTVSQILSHRSAQKSPLNAPTKHSPTFPFLNLPYELRRQIYSYLLPKTIDRKTSGQLLDDLRVLGVPTTTRVPHDTTLWLRGQTSLLCVNRQLLDECSSILYGTNTFILFVAYDTITFRFRWLLPSGLTPNVSHDFLGLLGDTPYLRLIKRLVVSVDHVDSYTGMIKYNVGGAGLTHGLKLQVRKLVRALREDVKGEDHGVKRLSVRLINGNEVLDTEKRGVVRLRETRIRSTKDVERVLDPLVELTGLVELNISGAVTDDFINELREKIMITTND